MKKEYLSVLFDNTPSAKQLTDEFGINGWQLCFLAPVDVHTQDGRDPTQKLQVYFIRDLQIPLTVV